MRKKGSGGGLFKKIFGGGGAAIRLKFDEQATTPTIGHGGSVLGGQAQLMIFPDEDMIVAVMTNASADVSGFARERREDTSSR